MKYLSFALTFDTRTVGMSTNFANVFMRIKVKSKIENFIKLSLFVSLLKKKERYIYPGTSDGDINLT